MGYIWPQRAGPVVNVTDTMAQAGRSRSGSLTKRTVEPVVWLTARLHTSPGRAVYCILSSQDLLQVPDIWPQTLMTPRGPRLSTLNPKTLTPQLSTTSLQEPKPKYLHKPLRGWAGECSSSDKAIIWEGQDYGVRGLRVVVGWTADCT